MMKHVVHVHQQKIRKGEPAIIDRTYKGSTHTVEAQILCPHCDGHVGVFRQTPEPDACGARVTFVTIGDVLIPEESCHE
jgi:hypothetical protein